MPVIISGTISGNCGVQGASVAWTPSAGSVTSAADGTYTTSTLSFTTYTVTPTKAGYSFNPPSRSVVLSSANVPNINFTASPTVTQVIVSV